MDPKVCVYLSLALFLEKWLQYGDGNLSQWLFCEGSTTNESPTADQDKEAKPMHEPSSVSLIVLHSPRQMTKDLVLILFKRQQQQKHGRRERQRMILITELDGQQSKCKMLMFLHNFYGLMSTVQVDCASRECASI